MQISLLLSGSAEIGQGDWVILTSQKKQASKQKPLSGVDGCHWPQQWPDIPVPSLKTQLAPRNSHDIHDVTHQ